MGNQLSTIEMYATSPILFRQIQFGFADINKTVKAKCFDRLNGLYLELPLQDKIEYSTPQRFCDSYGNILSVSNKHVLKHRLISAKLPFPCLP